MWQVMTLATNPPDPPSPLLPRVEMSYISTEASKNQQQPHMTEDL